MDISLQVTDIAHGIQLAVAPVFLLTGIGAFLSVLSFRLGRVVDRARQLEDRLAGADEERQLGIHNELGFLSRRSRLINRAITLCTACALLVCTVIVVLFVGAFGGLDVAYPIAMLFIVSMVSLIASLLIFLREIQLATATLRIGHH